VLYAVSIARGCLLAHAARHGDQHAWTTLIERYAPLMVSICRRYRLTNADTDDVAQTVWLRLVDQLAKIRNPAALAGWIATATARECAKINWAARPSGSRCPHRRRARRSARLA
jgi:DNA-directed RNA polymerase specialized sigma24 family protein